MVQRKAGLQSLGLVAQPEEPKHTPWGIWGVPEGERSTGLAVAGYEAVLESRLQTESAGEQT